MRTRTHFKTHFVSLVSVVQSRCVRPFFASTESQESKSDMNIAQQWTLGYIQAIQAMLYSRSMLSEPELVIAESKLVRSCFQSKYKSHLQMFFVDGGRWRGWIRYGKPHKLEYFWRKMMLHLIFLISNTSKTLVYLLLQQSLPWDWINFDILVHLLFLCTGSCHLMKVFWWNLRLKEQKS